MPRLSDEERVVQKAIQKVPELDLSWPRRQQDQWWGIVSRIVEQGRHLLQGRIKALESDLAEREAALAGLGQAEAELRQYETIRIEADQSERNHQDALRRLYEAEAEVERLNVWQNTAICGLNGWGPATTLGESLLDPDAIKAHIEGIHDALREERQKREQAEADRDLHAADAVALRARCERMVQASKRAEERITEADRAGWDRRGQKVLEMIAPLGAPKCVASHIRNQSYQPPKEPGE